MQMADALLSPTVGRIMWGATAAKTIYSARKIQNSLDNRKIPLMGVLGAFVFATQMINFAIPGTGSILAAIIGLQLGAFGVVLATYFSGISALPFSSFILLMQPIHLGIGLVEGLATAGVISFIWKARPEIIDRAMREQPIGQIPMRNILVMFLFATGLIGGIFAWYASVHPDGLEWAIAKVTGSPELENQEQSIHQALENVQEKTSLMPDYAFRQKADSPEPSRAETREATTIAGLLGGILVLGLGIIMGFLLKKHRTAA